MPLSVLSLPPHLISTLNSFSLFWEHSPLWLLPIALVSGFISWWQYRDSNFQAGMRYLLGILRGLAYFILGLLLLNPLIRYFKENILPPVSVILVDDSRSIKLSSRPDSLRLFQDNIPALKKKLESAGNQVYVENLENPVPDGSSLKFERESSNLEAALRRITETYEGQNLTQVIVASDGIINRGSDLQEFNPAFRIHTIGLGNPRQARDLRIRDLQYNRVAFLGNQFPVRVEIQGNGLKTNQFRVFLKEGSRIIESRLVSLSPTSLARTDFSVPANLAGIREFRIELEGQEGEVTLENNRRVFFIETVRQKQKVLILASCPHPDLKAIRQALEPLEQLEVSDCISGIDVFRPDNYSLVILHQLPDLRGSFAPEVSRLLKSPGTAVWLIATQFTDFSRLRLDAASWLNTEAAKGRMEESGNRFEENFQGFEYEEQYRRILAEMPPVKTPGVSFFWKGNADVIIRQLIGRVATRFPLLSVQVSGNSRRALFWGDGLWLWRLNEYGRTENTLAMDNLIRKICLLLLSQEKKKQLRVVALADEFAESENPAFRVETFNQLMEPVFDRKVQLRISSKGLKPLEYTPVTVNGNPPFKINNLPAGVWHYEATANIDGKELKDEGDFIVRNFDLEAGQLEANHMLLQNLATKAKGKFHYIAEMNKLAVAEPKQPLAEFTEWNENILSLKMILYFLLLLLSAEWFLRKFNGEL